MGAEPEVEEAGSHASPGASSGRSRQRCGSGIKAAMQRDSRLEWRHTRSASSSWCAEPPRPPTAALRLQMMQSCRQSRTIVLSCQPSRLA